MRERKLLWTAAGTLIVLVSLILVGNSAWLVPELPLRTVFLKSVWVLTLCGLLFLLVFKVLDHYYLKLNRQVGHLATLHESLLHLNANLSIEHRCCQALSILMELTRGSKGLFVILDPELKKYSEAESFSIQKSEARFPLASHFRYQIFTPGRLPAESRQQLDELVKTHRFSSFPSVIVVPFYN
ncbi:MAG TPA: hypothetical protein PKX93_10285, partial [bacterium]|nr:hypothetical protein [bacterium]